MCSMWRSRVASAVGAESPTATDPTVAQLADVLRTTAPVGADTDDIVREAIEIRDAVSGGGERNRPPRGSDRTNRLEQMLDMARERASGRPLAYVTGRQRFWNAEFSVGDGVFIPHVATEVLVAVASYILGRHGRPTFGLEIGVGSGVASISLMRQFDELRMTATEISEEAIQAARRNASALLADRAGGLDVRRPASVSDVWSAFDLHRAADFAISNPPYLVHSDRIDWSVCGMMPTEALFAPGGDRLHFYRAIAAGAERYVRCGGYLFLEGPAKNADDIVTLFEERDWTVEVWSREVLDGLVHSGVIPWGVSRNLTSEGGQGVVRGQRVFVVRLT